MGSLFSGMWSDKFWGKSVNITVILRPIPKMIKYLDSFYLRIFNQRIFQVNFEMN